MLFIIRVAFFTILITGRLTTAVADKTVFLEFTCVLNINSLYKRIIQIIQTTTRSRRIQKAVGRHAFSVDTTSVNLVRYVSMV